MAAGEISSCEEEEEVGNEAVRENQNNNKKYNGGSIIGEEMFIHSDSLEDGDEITDAEVADDEEVTDAEVAEVEKRLKLMRLEEKRLKKMAK